MTVGGDVKLVAGFTDNCAVLPSGMERYKSAVLYTLSPEAVVVKLIFCRWRRTVVSVKEARV